MWPKTSVDFKIESVAKPRHDKSVEEVLAELCDSITNMHVWMTTKALWNTWVRYETAKNKMLRKLRLRTQAEANYSIAITAIVKH